MSSAHARYAIRRFDFNAMGCPCALQIEADAEVAARAAAAAQAEVDRLDRKYSHYRDDSLVAQIGHSADAGESIVVDNETADLLDFSATLHAQSGGRFDITAGALTKLWDLQSGRVPDAAAIERARARCGWDRVEWNRPQLRLGVHGMRLDLGGVVKEYAADRAAQVCRDVGIVHGIVDLGGDLTVVGAHADRSPWLAGIKAPRDTSRAVAQIELHSGGLATSGDYERAVIVDGRRYSHIVDPVSGYPVESFASVSVVADSCLVAGAASTLGMLLGLREGHDWLIGLGLPFLCIDADGNASGTLAKSRD
ncbi:MAG TPA: FAD:protein FMN transferase [Rudaea sp.]|nr:FAD:protein FMN transferase [Rudaea sp.]